METWYDVKEGRLKFFYGWVKDESEAEISGFVPEKIAEKGEKAVAGYVSARVKKYERAIERRSRNVRKKISATNVPIEIRCGKTLLKGRIIDYRGPKSDRGAITVLLESPKKYRGEDHHCMCFGLAMSGKQFFKANGDLTEWAVEFAKSSLVEMFKKRKKEISKQKSNRLAYKIMKNLNR